MLLYQRVYNITKGDYHMLSFMEAQHHQISLKQWLLTFDQRSDHL